MRGGRYPIFGIEVVESCFLLLSIFENNGKPVSDTHFSEHFIGLGIEMQARQMRVVDLFQSKLDQPFPGAVYPTHSGVD